MEMYKTGISRRRFISGSAALAGTAMLYNPLLAVAPVAKEQVVVEDSTLEKSLKILRGLGTPKGFFRDLIIIGNKVYTEAYTGEFEELDEPPEGIFFSSSHVPRMICENGLVRAIEFLKPEEGAELSEEDEKISQDIEDLLAMFEIEVG